MLLPDATVSTVVYTVGEITLPYHISKVVLIKAEKKENLV